MTKPRARFYETSPGVFSPLDDGVIAAPEPAGPAGSLAGATGWVPVSSVMALIKKWEDSANGWESSAQAYAGTGDHHLAHECGEWSRMAKDFVADLRAQMAAATVRQPAPNDRNEPRHE
jgi:hypothetical protein